MNGFFNPPWAEGLTRTTFEWGRIQSNVDWIPPIAACVAILVFVWAMYRRDAEELSPIWGWVLTILRSAAFFGLLIIYLQPHWRTEREEVRNSRVLLLVDTSLSMGLSDSSAAPASVAGQTRWQELTDALAQSDLISRLRQTHDVLVYRFDEGLKEDHVLKLEKISAEKEPSPGDKTETGHPDSGKNGALDWQEFLKPIGGETRLGQALQQLVQKEQSPSLSGVVVFSDGGQNAGVSPDVAVELAKEAEIPIFTVGLGSDRQPTNVAVADLTLPPRAFPGDHYTVTGFLQGQGMGGKTVTVQVLSRPADAAPETGREKLLDAQQITLGGDGEIVPVKFDLLPDEVGRYTLVLRVQPPADDQNPADNFREADIEIIDRKNRVLLFADAATREYQFLRNMLFRDRYTTVDVCLQSSPEGISQDAHEVLEDFPTTREEMFEYDCLVAFDPNWQELSQSQVELLEKWVAEQGGGLIVVGGAVHTCRSDGWTQNPNLAVIRNLYPVEFFGSASFAGTTAMFTSREPWPLDFTREGLEAEFLWPADSATASREAWGEFRGVYSCCPVRGPKPGATVFARYSDPDAVQGGSAPVYLAGQFYGAGFVFYLGSGEMWRLRTVKESYFEQFYTKLIRHVSQGRLLRGSSRGVLLVGQDRYLLGNTVEVRAQLTDLRLEPLTAPTVDLQVIAPDGSTQNVTLRADPAKAGAYLGNFPAVLEGTYRLELLVPESGNERLTRRVQVKAPDLERENPRRNDTLLGTIAKNTGGRYYIGMKQAVAKSGIPPLVAQLKDRTTTVILPVAPNPQTEEDWRRWMMFALCGVLCLEWLIRRLLKLA